MFVGLSIKVVSDSEVLVECPDEECTTATAHQFELRGIPVTVSGNVLATSQRKWTETLTAIVDIENSSFWNTKAN